MIKWIADRVEVTPLENAVWWVGVFITIFGVLSNPKIVFFGLAISGLAGMLAVLRKSRSQ